MMNLLTKSLVIVTILSLGFMLASPAATAQDLASRQQAVCSLLTERTGKITENFAERDSKLAEAKQSVNSKKQSYRQAVGDKTGERRAEGDAERKEIYDAMHSKAETEDDKTAVTAYQLAVEAAVQAYREAYDSSQAVYRQKLDAYLDSRQQRTEAAIAEYRQAVEVAIDTASSACKRRSPNLGQIRSEFVDALQAARLAYADARRTITPSLQEVIEEYADERNQARTDARRLFEQAMQTARNLMTPDIQAH